MTNYAYLDENNIVIAVTVGKDKNESIDGLDPEIYYALGTPYQVKEISNGGIGYSYDSVLNAFISPRCHESAILNKDTCTWECEDVSHTEAL